MYQIRPQHFSTTEFVEMLKAMEPFFVYPEEFGMDSRPHLDNGTKLPVSYLRTIRSTDNPFIKLEILKITVNIDLCSFLDKLPVETTIILPNFSEEKWEGEEYFDRTPTGWAYAGYFTE